MDAEGNGEKKNDSISYVRRPIYPILTSREGGGSGEEPLGVPAGSGAILYLWGSRIVYSTIYAGGEKIPFKHTHTHTGESCCY